MPANHRPVGQDDVQPEHRITHRAVADGAKATGVGGHHAADGGRIACGQIHAEQQAVRARRPVHCGQTRPGACPDATRCDIHGADVGEPLGGQQHVVVFGHGSGH
jgi:hypothetical protein